MSTPLLAARKRSRRIGAGLISGISGAALLVGALAAPALAEEVVEPSPDSGASEADWQGPTSGGTAVDLPVESFSQISSREYHSLAVTTTGRAFAWGFNGNGRLGDGTEETRSTPVEVQHGEMPADVAFAAVSAGTHHSTAIGTDGKLYTWGYNGDYQLGNGDLAGRYQISPVAVQQGAIPEGVAMTQISSGNGHTLALGDDGVIYSWGYNGGGWLGDGSTLTRVAPVAAARGAIPEGARITQVAAGDWHSLALDDAGNVYGWGYDSRGQVGTGSGETFTQTPQLVARGAIPEGVKIVQISANRHTSLALGDNGKVYAWGQNDSGQLGDGTTNHASVPVEVSAGAMPEGTRIVQISNGQTQSLAVASDGSVYAWGGDNDTWGLLGDGSGVNSAVPVRVANGELRADDPVVSLSAGHRHNIARTASGAVYAWGAAGNGWVGNGADDAQPTPVLSANLVTSAVAFGDAPAAEVQASPGSVRATSPQHASGIVPVTLQSQAFGGSVAGSGPAVTLEVGTFQFGTAPVVTLQPVPVEAEIGSEARFTAAADGDEAPSVRWQQSADGENWSDIDGSTAAEHVVSDVTAEDDGTLYRAVFTNPLGEAVTESAALQVERPEDPGTETSDSDSDADSDAGSESNAGTDANANSNSGSDANASSGSDAGGDDGGKEATSPTRTTETGATDAGADGLARTGGNDLFPLLGVSALLLAGGLLTRRLARSQR